MSNKNDEIKNLLNQTQHSQKTRKKIGKIEKKVVTEESVKAELEKQKAMENQKLNTEDQKSKEKRSFTAAIGVDTLFSFESIEKKFKTSEPIEEQTLDIVEPVQTKTEPKKRPAKKGQAKNNQNKKKQTPKAAGTNAQSKKQAPKAGATNAQPKKQVVQNKKVASTRFNRELTPVELEMKKYELKNFSRTSNQSDRNIEMKHVYLRIDNDQILRDVNLKVKNGEFVYFVGTSGAGKSSLVKLIYRERKNTAGAIYVNGINISLIPQRKLHMLRRKVGVVFQDYKLLEDKTIYENVKFSLDVTGYAKKEKREQVLRVLDEVGILEYRDKFPAELSGGQQQRAAIARAIVDQPTILVCDEPTGNLDPENAEAIMEILTKIHQRGTTILMATHDVGIVNKYKHRVVRMKAGEITNESKGEYIYD